MREIPPHIYKANFETAVVYVSVIEIFPMTHVWSGKRMSFKTIFFQLFKTAPSVE